MTIGLMTILQAIISGIVQGVTEFLPVSSSGHLVLLHTLFKAEGPALFFDIILHAGTLLAVIIYFRKDLMGLIFNDRAGLAKIIVATIPAASVAIIFGEKIEGLFASPRLVFYMFFVTAVWLLLGNMAMGFDKGKAKKENGPGPNIFTAFLIGVAQAVAIIPGISRSGATISTGLMLGLGREKAFKFSFLMSVPAVLGALGYKVIKEYPITLGGQRTAYLSGTLAAFIVGLFSIKLLSDVLKKKRLVIFSAYCIFAGLVGILVIYLKDVF